MVDVKELALILALELDSMIRVARGDIVNKHMSIVVHAPQA